MIAAGLTPNWNTIHEIMSDGEYQSVYSTNDTGLPFGIRSGDPLPESTRHEVAIRMAL
jgi:hypothetical protein